MSDMPEEVKTADEPKMADLLKSTNWTDGSPLNLQPPIDELGVENQAFQLEDQAFPPDETSEGTAKSTERKRETSAPPREMLSFRLPATDREVRKSRNREEKRKRRQKREKDSLNLSVEAGFGKDSDSSVGNPFWGSSSRVAPEVPPGDSNGSDLGSTTGILPSTNGRHVRFEDKGIEENPVRVSPEPLPRVSIGADLGTKTGQGHNIKDRVVRFEKNEIEGFPPNVAPEVSPQAGSADISIGNSVIRSPLGRLPKMNGQCVKFEDQSRDGDGVAREERTQSSSSRNNADEDVMTSVPMTSTSPVTLGEYEQPRRRRGSRRGSDFSELEDLGWDTSLEIPHHVDDACSRACASNFEYFLKVALVALLFLLVFGGGALHQVTFIIMANQLWAPADTWYACSDQSATCLPLTWANTSDTSVIAPCLSGGAVYHKKRCLAGAARWAWGLLLVLVIPDLLVMLRCLFYWLTDSALGGNSSTSLTAEETKVRRQRKVKAYLAVLVVEALRAVGVCLFIFVCLPLVESDVHRVALFSCTSLVPSLLNVFMSYTHKSTRYKRVCDIMAAICQLTALLMWPLIVGLRQVDWSIHLAWAIPLSLLFVSVPYFFNYYDSPRISKTGDTMLSGMAQVRVDIYNSRNTIYLVVSPFKVLLYFSLMCLFTNVSYHDLDVFDLSFSSCDHNHLTPSILPGMGSDWGWVLLINFLSGLICYLSARTASRICCQVVGYAVPLMLTPVLVFLFFLGTCETYLTDRCIYEPLLPPHLSFACPVNSSWHHQLFACWAWLFFLWWLSKLWIARHIWSPTNIKLAKADSIFFAPLYDGVFLENSLMMNRMKQVPEERQSKKPVPTVKICATMWHEDSAEMASLIKSICRLDIDQSTRAFCQDRYDIIDPDFYKFEGHIFFDDALEKFNAGMKLEKGSCEEDFDVDGKRVNGFVRSLVETVQEASINYPIETPIRAPEKVSTPYGGRLIWTLPGGNKIIVHLKDKSLIKHKKRWSQVMYMYYFMGYELNEKRQSERFTKEDLQDEADYTFLLALDGDVDFEPKAVILLLDRMRRDNIVGAVCGRIHPIGSGPMVWYQKFEYALGHWLQKSTEHVLGSVLCSPGCFSLFRGSAIMDVNVMKSYTHESTEARHHVQYDQGEDRWLCTLLLQQGWHVEYCAASDAFTQAPTGFEEFFKQRRRWMPSTMANILDLLISWRSTIQRNPYVTFAYIAYQMLMFVLSLLGSGTIFLMITDAVAEAFSNIISPYVFLSLNLFMLILFVGTCFLAKENNQISLAMVLSTIYAVAQGVVLVSVIVKMAEDGPCSDTFVFFMVVSGVFLLSAIVHPKEFFCVVHGLLYFFLVPSMYMLLMIYALMNLNNVSWGVRETAESGITKAIEKGKEKKAQMEMEQEVAKASGLQRFFGTGAGGNETGWTLRVGGCFRFTCCPRQSETDVEAVMAQNSRLENKVEALTELVQDIKDKLETTADDTEQSPAVTGSSLPDLTSHHEQDLTEEVSPRSGTEDAATEEEQHPKRDRPLTWLADRQYMPAGDIDELPDKEREFFEELIEKYLKPKVETEAGKQQLKQDLKDLRNKVSFSYLLMNIMFVVIVFTLKQFEVQIPWICGITIDPISLIFISLFGLVLLLQTLGMLAHRFDTVVQIVANTSVTGAEERRARQGVHDLFNAVQTSNNFQMENTLHNAKTGTNIGDNSIGTRRKLTVIENAQYQHQLVRAQRKATEEAEDGGGSAGERQLESVWAKRVDRALREDPKRHRKSILMTSGGHPGVPSVPNRNQLEIVAEDKESST